MSPNGSAPRRKEQIASSLLRQEPPERYKQPTIAFAEAHDLPVPTPAPAGEDPQLQAALEELLTLVPHTPTNGK